MNKQSFYRGSIALCIGLGTLSALTLGVFTPSAEAGCHPTGRMVGGQPVLNCSGPTRCRPTGRFKTVRGVRYQILRCPPPR
jgi:hypothetical protein